LKKIDDRTVVLNLGSLINDLRSKYNIDLQELHGIVKSRDIDKVEFSGIIRFDRLPFKFHIVGEDVSFYDYSLDIRRGLKDVFQLNSLSQLPDTLEKYVETLAKFLKTIEKHYHLFTTSAAKHGYTVSIPMDEDPQYRKLSYFKAQKQTKYTETEVVHEVIVKDKEYLPWRKYGLEYRIKIHVGRKIEDYTLTVLQDILNMVVDKDETGIIIRGTLPVNEATDYDELFDKIDTIISRVEDMYEKEIKDILKPPSKDNYIAVSLVAEFTSIMPGFLRSKFEEKLYDIAKNLGITENSTLHILAELYDSGYITIDNNLNVYVNNKRVKELVKPFISEIPENLEKTIAFKLLDTYLRLYGSGQKSIIEVLVEKGIVSDEILSEAINTLNYTIPPTSLAREYNGKPIWNYLGEKSKNTYIQKLNTSTLAEIYYTPELRRVFSDYIDKIEEQLLYSGEPSIVTRIVVEKYGDKVGIPDNKRIIRGKEFYGVKIGNHMMQVLRVSDNNSLFIVYDEKKKGFVIPAKTALEAIEIFENRYERLIKILGTLRDLQKMKVLEKHGITLRTKVDGNYIYYYIEENNKIIPVSEGILAKLKLKSSEEELVSN